MVAAAAHGSLTIGGGLGFLLRLERDSLFLLLMRSTVAKTCAANAKDEKLEN
jgi:hypothetical protein